MDDVKVTGVQYPDANGGISLAAESPAFAVLAQECVKMFKGQGAINYCEWKMNSGDPAFGTFSVIIQREAGETPAQQNSRLKTRLREIYQQHGCTKLDGNGCFICDMTGEFSGLADPK